MKKIIFSIVVVTIFFSGMYIIYNKKSNSVNSPINQKDINPTELKSLIKSKNNIIVYFYSPECEHCEKVTPVLMNVSKELGIDFKAYNVLKYQEGWDEYNIQGTPTIIKFNKGVEKERLIGEKGEKELKQWIIM